MEVSIMRRHELSDAQWELVKAHIPERTSATGRPPRDPRDMLNGMMWIVRTGAPWRDLPERFGPWQTVYDYFTEWRQGGVLDQVLEALQIRLDADGHVDCGASMAVRFGPVELQPALQKKLPAIQRRAARPCTGSLARRIREQTAPGH
jgi:transposase